MNPPIYHCPNIIMYLFSGPYKVTRPCPTQPAAKIRRIRPVFFSFVRVGQQQQQQQGKHVKGFPSPFGWLERSPPVHVYKKLRSNLSQRQSQSRHFDVCAQQSAGQLGWTHAGSGCFIPVRDREEQSNEFAFGRAGFLDALHGRHPQQRSSESARIGGCQSSRGFVSIAFPVGFGPPVLLRLPGHDRRLPQL
ncbi:hypothetical protein DAPPUDRAFT_227174 [Daphnia pulex]|uniref:Uncharacterized protein n=1 Tax=Daphnia pulex TaxID=6669 RepID=E9H4Y3_DAPPU|nr:hypothetical protein DAPPUDRAFT_227174 [Daphnia pulex]|eukprot:EFX73272.1 hypothetical protein DAPPUDRAFT_227174 [Daphnia pulex]